MTEFTILSGTASYQRVKQPATYESQTPALTLNFEVTPGSDPELVTAKVMLMCRNAVEGTFSSTAASLEPAKPQRGRPRANAPEDTKVDGGGSVLMPTEPATVSPAAEDLSDLAALVEATDQGSADDAEDEELATLAGTASEPPPQYTASDVQTALMKVSEYLRKEFGHINDIKKLIASFGVAGYSALKPEQYAVFIDKAKGLCDLKKS